MQQLCKILKRFLYCFFTNYTYRFEMQPLGAFNFEKTTLDQFSYENSMPQSSFFTLHLQVCFSVCKTERQQNYCKIFCYLTCEQLLLRVFFIGQKVELFFHFYQHIFEQFASLVHFSQHYLLVTYIIFCTQSCPL